MARHFQSETRMEGVSIFTKNIESSTSDFATTETEDDAHNILTESLNSFDDGLAALDDPVSFELFDLENGSSLDSGCLNAKDNKFVTYENFVMGVDKYKNKPIVESIKEESVSDFMMALDELETYYDEDLTDYDYQSDFKLFNKLNNTSDSGIAGSDIDVDKNVSFMNNKMEVDKNKDIDNQVSEKKDTNEHLHTINDYTKSVTGALGTDIHRTSNNEDMAVTYLNFDKSPGKKSNDTVADEAITEDLISDDDDHMSSDDITLDVSSIYSETDEPTFENFDTVDENVKVDDQLVSNMDEDPITVPELFNLARIFEPIYDEMMEKAALKRQMKIAKQ